MASVLAVLFLFFLGFGVLRGVKRCCAPEVVEPLSARWLQRGEVVRMCESIPSGHVVWKDINRLREARACPERSVDIMLQATREGGTRRIKGGTEVTVHRVDETPDADGFYYVQIEYRGRCWWVEEVVLDL